MSWILSLDALHHVATSVCVRCLLSDILSNASVWYSEYKRQRKYRSNHVRQERSFARSNSYDDIKLRNKSMTYQICNDDLSDSVNIRKREDYISRYSTYAEPEITIRFLLPHKDLSLSLPLSFG